MNQKDNRRPSSQLLESNISALGPLVVSDTNPRYFTVASGEAAEQKAVYLTGSHIWNNFHDGMGPGPDCAATPQAVDFVAYLKFLKEHNHNFTHLCMTPQYPGVIIPEQADQPSV